MSVTEKIQDEVERALLMIFSGVTGYISDVSSFGVEFITGQVRKHDEWRDLMDLGGEATLREFQRAVKNGEKLFSLRVDDSMLNDYRRLMNENQVMFVCFDDIESEHKVILFKEGKKTNDAPSDLDKMEKIKKQVEMLHAYGFEVEPGTFVDAMFKSEMGMINGLSQVEAELFKHFMKQEGRVFSLYEKKDGEIVILHELKDEAKIRRALEKANWALDGRFGERVREQIKYRIDEREKIALALDDPSQDFYIVSHSNPKNFVHINEHGAFYYKNDKKVKEISRDDPDFAGYAWDKIESISAPVLFAKEEFSLDIVERQKVLDSKQTLDAFPADMIVEEEMNKYNKLRQLVSEKMGIDNENQGDWALYAENITYSEFEGREEMLDNDEAKLEFENLKTSCKHTYEKRIEEKVEVSDKNIDIVISKAEARAHNNEMGDKRENRGFERG